MRWSLQINPTVSVLLPKLLEKYIRGNIIFYSKELLFDSQFGLRTGLNNRISIGKI